MPARGADPRAELARLAREAAELEGRTARLALALPGLRERVEAVRDPLLRRVEAHRLELLGLAESALRAARKPPFRRALLDLLARMGADLEERFGLELSGRAAAWEGSGASDDEDDSPATFARAWRGAASPDSRSSRPRPAAGPDPAGLARELHRALLRGLHPDKARDEPERARRTELLQKAGEALAQLDLATLAELASGLEGISAAVVPGVPDGTLLAAARERRDEAARAWRNLSDRGDGIDWAGLLDDPGPAASRMGPLLRELRSELDFLEDCRVRWRRPGGIARWLEGGAR